MSLIIQEFSSLPIDLTQVTEQEQLEFLGKILTDVTKLDVNKDGIDDIITTTVADDAGNVVGQVVNVDTENIDTNSRFD